MEEEEHARYHKRLVYIVILILLILFGSATFYHYAEKWSYLDSLYFSAATMTTVGYGDITPKTVVGKLFTIVYVFAGVGIALYGLSLIASHFVEVREEFWLQKIGKMQMSHRTQNVWGKLKNMFSYHSDQVVKGYETSVKHKK